LHNKPTCVNNVETYALVPWIVRHGAEAFAAIGTEKSKGTKVFSLAGAVQRGGLIEVPMGTTIRQIVQEIGGGVAKGRTFKAVQIGGPSGGCVPASLADTPVDYEALVGVGAIMGSGGIVVLDDKTCMVDLARYFLDFLQRESCGQCTMCRVGLARMHELLEKICRGEGHATDLAKLEELSKSVKIGSLCGLGQTGPNPVLSTLRHFREEYEAHLRGECPAGKCPALIHYRVLDNCIGCTLCDQACPTDAVIGRPFSRYEINDEKCIRCDACREACPENTIEVK
jgi:NADH-quinone oxidoreductase subunit F